VAPDRAEEAGEGVRGKRTLIDTGRVRCDAMNDTFVDVPGGSLFASDSGGDGEPVLLLHAGVTDSRVWDETAPRLSDASPRTPAAPEG